MLGSTMSLLAMCTALALIYLITGVFEIEGAIGDRSGLLLDNSSLFLLS